MSIVSAELRTFFEDMIRNLSSMTDASGAMVSNRADVRLVENQHSEATVRGFTVVQDEPASVMGGGKGPTPTDFFVAAVGFCENVIFAREAALSGIEVQRLETTVTGRWDRRGLFEIDGVEPAFTEVTVETKVTTRDSVERVAEAARATHRRCPVHATLRKGTNLNFALVVNGMPVPL